MGKLLRGGGGKRWHHGLNRIISKGSRLISFNENQVGITHLTYESELLVTLLALLPSLLPILTHFLELLLLLIRQKCLNASFLLLH